MSLTFFIHLPMKIEPIRSSETSTIKTQTPGNYPKRNILQLLVTFTSSTSSSRQYRRSKSPSELRLQPAKDTVVLQVTQFRPSAAICQRPKSVGTAVLHAVVVVSLYNSQKAARTKSNTIPSKVPSRYHSFFKRLKVASVGISNSNKIGLQVNVIMGSLVG